MNAFEKIEGFGSVLQVFGNWPSFHDGEVHQLLLDSTRRDETGRRYASIELKLRGWNLTQELTDGGLYRITDDSIVHLLFEQASDVELDGLNHQNVLSELKLVAEDDAGNEFVQVSLVHCWGLSGSFRAVRAKVISVTPYATNSDA